MPSSDFEKVTSIKLVSPNKGESVFSAIFEQDPHFLHWNRISLIGTDADYRRFLPFSAEALQWELYVNPKWSESGEHQRTSGEAFITRSGRASGLTIASDGIQKFATLKITKYVKTHAVTDGRLSAVYAFLQRSSAWDPYSKLPKDSRLSVRGEWQKIPSIGLKLRLLTDGYRRKDPRISQEIELIEIPGVEIGPIADMSSEAFVLAAEKLWFSIRVLLMFRFRQSVTPLVEQISAADEIRATWHSVEIEPRHEANPFDVIDFNGRVDRFLVQAAPVLATQDDQIGLLHAATWGYATSFGMSVMEAQLTDRVEAIERLITVYEKASDLNRDRVAINHWKPIKKALKTTIDSLDIDSKLANDLKRGFGSSPPLILEERIQRMAAKYSSKWNHQEQDLLKGVGAMIKARNAIVHGRLVEDANSLPVERLRAQVIFEKLFTSFTECDDYYTSGYSLECILHIERQFERTDGA
ncbi:hypothetical protein GOZ94_01540 [Agrobacterium vitis]|uniref:hypothetical protein n=1 Tax=Agrobacterium vitis TaxID=373 RepID=UPI0012E8805C|nr:hypothetical protein [Agrobacterium vitis]MVA17627.1 hypothetical protein [Agrobacterium vitis]